MIKTNNLAGKTVIALTAAALLITLCPAAAQAQQAISTGDAKTQRTKGMDDLEFVGKWDFDEPAGYGSWKPLQKGAFELESGVVHVTAKSQRPCLNLTGSFNAEEISSIEIRIRGIEVERETPSEGGKAERVRIGNQVYEGSRLYFAGSHKERFDAAKSFELPVRHDGKFHILAINPHANPSWKGMIQKIRFDVGDFPNRYELDFIYFRRAASPKKGDTESEKKTAAKAEAVSTESEK